MTDRRSRLEQLLNLAGETSSDRRRELLNEITDVFLTEPESYSDQEARYFGEIMGEVAYALEQEVRVELARKLASEAAAPADLIRQLASDEISVAQPVLEQSPVLDEDDLIEIAKKNGQDHMAAMTQRDDIGEKLSEVLVEEGDDRVVQGLVENKNAQIGQETMGKVVKRAEGSALLHKPLIDRPDLPAEMMREMLSFVSNELTQTILEQSNHVNAERLKSIVEEVGESIQNKSNMDAKVRSKPEFLIDQLERNGELNEHKLCELAKQKMIPEFICGLARIADVDMNTARRILQDRSGEGLAIIAKACNFEQSTYSSLINNVWPEGERTIEQSCRLIALYDQVKLETAQRVMRFWRLRRNSSGEGEEQQQSAG